MRITKQLKMTQTLFCFFIIIYLFVHQLANINPFAATWDQVDFALALSRYDLLAMQPHFPGYPYFILGGKLFYTIIENPAKALTIFNIFLFATSVYPIYQLGRRYLSKDKSLLLATVIYSSSFILLLVNQPVSEGAAISIFWWYIWSLERSLYSTRAIHLLLPYLFLSILFGIRLSYIPFSIGILFVLMGKWKTKTLSMKDFLFYGMLGIFFQLIWVLAIVLSEGSFSGFIKLALAFTNGHFGEWGGSIGSNSLSLFNRIYIFIVKNIFWTGFFAHSYIIFILFVFLLLLFIFKMVKTRFSINRFYALIIVLSFSYFLWALLAQNIDKPRHIIPVVALNLFLLFLSFLRQDHKLEILYVSIFVAAQFFHSVQLIKEQAIQLPATYQLETYLVEKEEPFIIYSWEETRVLEYLKADFPHKKVQTFEVFKHDSGYYEDYEIFLTDKVVSGFEHQGINLTNKLEKVTVFRSNELFDPVYNRIILYKWKK